jgi:hypothetical protein
MAEQPVRAAGNGSDAFVTDRDDKGQPKAPETAEVPRVAKKKDKEAAPAIPAAVAPAKKDLIEYIPTEDLLKIIEDMPKQDDFAQSREKQDALVALTNVLKGRPVLPPEPPKGQPAAAAPAPAAAPVASVKEAKGEPFGGKQAPPFGSEKKEEKAEDKKEAAVDKTAVAPEGWEGTVKEMKKEKDIDNPWALAWSMKDKGYTPHAGSWLMKRKGAAYIQKKFGSSGNAGGAWTSDADTSKVEEGSKVPEIAQAHGLRDDNTGIARPATTLPSKLAAEMTTSKALKAATDAQEKLKALYLDCKPLTEANNTRPVRGAVELVYAAYSAFDEAVKVFNKQLMQEEQEAEAAEIVEKKKKSSWGGLVVAAAE